MGHEGNDCGAQPADPEDTRRPSSPGLLGKDVAYKAPVLSCFCLCCLITLLGPNETHVSQTPFSPRRGKGIYLQELYFFFQALYGDTPAPLGC